MSDEITVAYTAESKTALLTFPNGRQLKLKNVTEEHARDFAKRHGPEFQRRDCILHSAGNIETRG